MEKQDIEFPTKDARYARIVLSPDFSLDNYPNLVVNLDEIRQVSNEDDPEYDFRTEIFSCLEVNKTTFLLPDDGAKLPTKIIFTGHRGCGKSTELRRFYRDLDRPGGYLCILVDSERDTNLGQFKWQDFFVLLIRGLVARLSEIGLMNPQTDYDRPYLVSLNNIIGEWITKKEVIWELHTRHGQHLQEGQAPGLDFLQNFFIQGQFVVAYDQNTQFARNIREQVTQNSVSVAQRLSEVLTLLRYELLQRTKYRGVLFIFDGTEKVNYEEYTALFYEGLSAIGHITAPIISSIPIAARYTLEGLGQEMSGYERVVLPMFRLQKPEHIARFSEIATRRIDAATFLADGVLDFAVEKSGGSPRQLLKLLEIGLRAAEGGTITRHHLVRAVYRLGYQMYEKLDGSHHHILNKVLKGTFKFTADKNVANLIAELVLIKYNGHYKINPILEGFDFHE